MLIIKAEPAKEPWEMTGYEYSRNVYAQQEAKVEKLKASSQEAFDKSNEITGGKGREQNERYIAEGMRIQKKVESEARKLLKSESYYVNKHKKIIQQALAEQKPVPRLVLEEYRGEEWADEAFEKAGYLDERRGITTEGERKQAVASGAFKRETAKYHREAQRELERRFRN